ncbi:MAG: hypothetical protein ACYC0M_11450 [Burkholderiales bacterium]
MNKIHKIVGLALQNSGGVGIYSGLVIGYFIHHFGQTNSVLFAHKDIILSVFFGLAFSFGPSARYFYTLDIFNEYMERRARGSKNWRLQPLEPLFYPTMISNISISRKIAGYMYALSQILIVTFMATLVFATVFDKFSK